MVIYVDVLLFVNTVINYAILMTTEKLLKRDCRLYRMIAGAFAGALFSLLIFVNTDSRLLMFLLKIISSSAITIITFGWKSKAEYIKAFISDIVVAVVYSGFLILFYEIARPPNMVIVNDVPYFQINPLILLFVTAVIYIILLLLYKLFSERIKNTVVTIGFTIADHSYSCIGIIDTGCNLTEPFSSSPVIITDRSVYQADPKLPIRIIPYTTVGGGSFLYAVKADSVTINHKPIHKTVYIASSEIHNKICQAITNSEIIR